MSAVSPAYRQLATQPAAALEAIFAAGAPPSIEALTGYEYLGYNCSRLTSLLGIRKFIKGFIRNAQGESFGYNTPVKQNGLDEDWIALPDANHPRRYAFFHMQPVDPMSRDNRYRHAVLLDYGRGGNKAYAIASLIRDYVVRVEPGSDELLLGKAYFAIGPLRLPANFFLLIRAHPVRR